MKTKEIRASAIQCGDTILFKPVRGDKGAPVGQFSIQSIESKVKGSRLISVVVGGRHYRLPWDRRVLLIDTRDEPVPPVADNRSETRRVPVAPEEPKSFADRIHPRLQRKNLEPAPPPVVVNGKSYPGAGDLPVGEPRPFKPMEPPMAPKYLDQSDRDALLMELLSLVTEFVVGAQALVRKAAGL